MKKNLELMAKEIVESRKFLRLGENYVVSLILRFLCKKEYIKLNPIIEKEDYASLKKKGLYKKFMKEVKSFLHDVYGVYQLRDSRVIDKIFSQMKKGEDLYEEILHCHSSTRERKEYYEEVYRNIFSICGKVKKILDVGCGLNAFSLPLIGFKNFEYVGCDFVEKDIKIVDEYLKKSGFKGEAFVADLHNEKDLKKIKNIKCDVCFAFKMNEVLDYFERGRNGTEGFLRDVKAKFVVFSFPTKTVSRRKMNRPRRTWFELMVKRLCYSYDYFEIENECFYVVKK